MKSLLTEGIDLSIVLLRLANFPTDEFGENRVHIHNIVANIKGGGRKAMEVICKNADKLDIVLSLNACPLRTHLYSTPLETEVLVKWYESFGFLRSQFHVNPFWSNMSYLMVRYARR